MENISKQIAGLKLHLRESKAKNKKLSDFRFSIYAFCEGLKSQNTLYGTLSDRSVGEKKCELTGRIDQNKYVIKELENILKNIENNP